MNTFSVSESYKKAGVDITAGYRAVELMKAHISRTKTPGVISDIGGFGGSFCARFNWNQRACSRFRHRWCWNEAKAPFLLDRHDTIGIDCVAMCVNDIIACGATPLFFLDISQWAKTSPSARLLLYPESPRGVRAGCALIGGETAEMPQLLWR